MLLETFNQELRILIRKNILSGSWCGTSLSYLNFHLLVYLRNLLGEQEFADTILLISERFSNPFAGQIYGENCTWLSNYSLDTTTRRRSEEPAIVRLKGRAVHCLSQSLQLAQSNRTELVFAILEDFKSFIHKVSVFDVRGMSRCLFIVDSTQHHYSSIKKAKVSLPEWEIRSFDKGNFKDLMDIITEARFAIAPGRPAIIFVKTCLQQILI